jgi:hypothetical protein
MFDAIEEERKKNVHTNRTSHYGYNQEKEKEKLSNIINKD